VLSGVFTVSLMCMLTRNATQTLVTVMYKKMEMF